MLTKMLTTPLSPGAVGQLDLTRNLASDLLGDSGARLATTSRPGLGELA